jgi:hypothetical protein
MFPSADLRWRARLAGPERFIRLHSPSEGIQITMRRVYTPYHASSAHMRSVTQVVTIGMPMKVAHCD